VQLGRSVPPAFTTISFAAERGDERWTAPITSAS